MLATEKETIRNIYKSVVQYAFSSHISTEIRRTYPEAFFKPLNSKPAEKIFLKFKTDYELARIPDEIAKHIFEPNGGERVFEAYIEFQGVAPNTPLWVACKSYYKQKLS